MVCLDMTLIPAYSMIKNLYYGSGFASLRGSGVKLTPPREVLLPICITVWMYRFFMYRFFHYFCFVAAIALICSNAAHANESTPLEGSFFVSPKSYIDPLPKEKNTHYRINLKGESAKQLYDLMDSKIEIDHCTGAKSKTVGAMQCLFFKNNRGYECHFSIDVKNQKIEFGLAC